VRARVKICGMREPADVRAAAGAGADTVGVIAGVSVDTHREVTTERARALVDAAPPFLSTTLVTMPDSPEEAARRVDRVGADHVQVHGLVDPEALDRLGEATPARVVAAVGHDDDPARLASHVDGLLVDSTDDAGGGGTGETHDWTASRRLVERVDAPVVLAGGLTPENVGRATRVVRPYGVDVASGVETGGTVDPERVRAFVDTARVEAPA
jgi:phosphoribosylanthranilate isomerase